MFISRQSWNLLSFFFKYILVKKLGIYFVPFVEMRDLIEAVLHVKKLINYLIRNYKDNGQCNSTKK